MSKTWFISDMHFGHTNIIKYENRPFTDVAAMNSEIIKRWNNTVAKDDIVWCLGDVGLGSKDYIRSIICQLNGHKRLVRGNHDNWSDQVYRDMGFEYVSKYPIVLKNFFVLSHEPMEYMGKCSPFYFIYGHVHGSPTYLSQTENSICVCVERWNYTPIRIKVFDDYNPGQLNN